MAVSFQCMTKFTTNKKKKLYYKCVPYSQEGRENMIMIWRETEDAGDSNWTFRDENKVHPRCN